MVPLSSTQVHRAHDQCSLPNNPLHGRAPPHLFHIIATKQHTTICTARGHCNKHRVSVDIPVPIYLPQGQGAEGIRYPCSDWGPCLTVATQLSHAEGRGAVIKSKRRNDLKRGHQMREKKTPNSV
jgi:hypothetical protein